MPNVEGDLSRVISGHAPRRAASSSPSPYSPPGHGKPRVKIIPVEAPDMLLGVGAGSPLGPTGRRPAGP